MFYVTENNYMKQIEEVNSQGTTLKQENNSVKKTPNQIIQQNDLLDNSDIFERDPQCEVNLYEEQDMDRMLKTISQAE